MFILPTFLALAASSPAGGGLGQILFIMVMMFVMMYFITIRPQRRRQKMLEEQINKMRPGDQIITTGGLHATLNSLKTTTALIKIAEGVKIEIERSAIATVLSKKTAEVSVTQQETETETSVS